MDKDQIKNYLLQTLEEAEKALEEGNFPIGSIVVDDQGETIGRFHNENFTKDDITAHAEILCLRRLRISDKQRSYSLFSSLEPCGGCAFFIARMNITNVYIAALDPYRPGISALKDSDEYSKLFSKLNLTICDSPDISSKSKALMKEFFLRTEQPDKAKYYE